MLLYIEELLPTSNRAEWMKGICHVWRQVSDTWLQKRPPGRNLREHRSVRRSGTTSRGTVALVFSWRMRSISKTEVLTLLPWVKPCTSDTEPGVIEETIRVKQQPGNENDFGPSTTIAGKLKTTKTQLSPPDQVFVNVSDSPYQPKNFKESNR